jgi:hypothetical protein
MKATPMAQLDRPAISPEPFGLRMHMPTPIRRPFSRKTALRCAGRACSMKTSFCGNTAT